MYAERFLSALRFGVKLLQDLNIINDRDQFVTDKLTELIRKYACQNNYRRAHTGLPQLDRFLHCRDAERVRSAAGQRLRDRRRAVTEKDGFHHAEDFNFCPDL